MSKSFVKVTFQIPLHEFGGDEIQKALVEKASAADLITQVCSMFRDSVVGRGGEIDELVGFAKDAELYTVVE